MLQNMNQRKRHLAFGKIVAQVLPGLRLIPGVIEYVVDQLECSPKVGPIPGQPGFCQRRCARNYRTEPGRSLEESGSLALNYVKVPGLVQIGVTSVDQLHDLAFGNGVGRIGKYLHDPHVADANHHLKGPRVQKVSDKHAGSVSVFRIGGSLAAAKRRFVHNIVVKQSCRVNELDDGRQFQMCGATIPPRPGRKQYQNRPQALASATDYVFRDGTDQHDIGIQSPANQGINRLKLGLNQFLDGFERQGGCEVRGGVGNIAGNENIMEPFDDLQDIDV